MEKVTEEQVVLGNEICWTNVNVPIMGFLEHHME